GLLEIGDEDLAARTLMHKARHHMDQLAAGCRAIGERGLQVASKVVLAAGQRRSAALTPGGIARRRVDQHELEAMTFKPSRDGGGGGLVGIANLDGFEASPGRCLKAIEQRHIGEQEVEVGAEAWHGLHGSKGGPRRLIMGAIERSLKASMRPIE